LSISSSIKYQVGGREVSQAEFLANMHSTVQKVISAKVGELLESRLRQLHCQEHGATPSVTFVSSSDDNLEFSVGGCCASLKSKTQELLAELGGRPDGQDDSAS
jgi:hypothetical protein